MRRFLIWSGRTLAVLLGLALLGTAYESVSESADPRATPHVATWSTSAAVAYTSTASAAVLRAW